MSSMITATARRFALTLTVAGIAALGSVAVAPVASAAPDASPYVIDGNGAGPDAFVVTATGRIPVFFCEDVKPGKDGVMDDKDVARAVAKAAKEAQHAADEADKAAKHAADEAEKAAKDADKAATDAAKKAADEAEKAAKDADKAAKEIVDRVMKQHNICLAMSPGGSRF